MRGRHVLRWMAAVLVGCVVGSGLVSTTQAVATTPVRAEAPVRVAAVNLVRNPSFTDHADLMGFWRDVVAGNQQLISPWRVVKHYGQMVSIENARNDKESAFHMGTWQSPAAGGNTPGAVAQTLDTLPGRRVFVEFSYAPLPHPSCQGQGNTGLGRIKASARDGGDTGIVLGDRTVVADTTNVRWRTARVFTFIPRSDTTSLYFESLPGDSFCSLMFSRVSAEEY